VKTTLAVAFAFAGLLSVAARAETIPMHATLDTASEVPPKSGGGKGMLSASFDTASKTLSYTLTFSGLTGPATAAHFHGPAAVGANAGVAVPIAGVASPSKGSATLTDAQIADLEAGKWYVNVHTAANPAGEIRGQVMKGK
jgi:hypothetical protein